MSTLFITGAGTDIGKTYIACRLIEALRAQGRGVEALKPIVSGFDEETAHESDPALLLRALGREASSDALAHISPYRFTAPLAANIAARREGVTLRLAEIEALCRARTGDPLLIEGAGGVMAPVDDDYTFLDLIAALGAPALLVAGSYLGAISHTLTAIAALEMRRCAVAAIVVNESADAPVSLTEHVAALFTLAPAHAFFPVARGGNLPSALLERINRA